MASNTRRLMTAHRATSAPVAVDDHASATPADDVSWREVAGLLGPESVSWKIGREGILLLGTTRAVLMQLAHPLVAAGVADHSAFAYDPWRRAVETIALGQRIAFGERRDALAAIRTINNLHKQVSGALGEAAGGLPAGAAYHARDPELLLWVHATTLDSLLLAYHHLVGPLTQVEREQYYHEANQSAILMGTPRAILPPTLADFDAYMARMLASETLTVIPAARRITRTLMRMPLAPPQRVIYPVADLLTIGTLPPRLRDLYGFTWGARQAATFRALTATIRTLLPFTPPPIRVVPAARQAERRVARYQRATHDQCAVHQVN